MAHLSINGFMSGAMLCGKSRSSAVGEGEDVSHPDVKLLENRIYRERICSVCLAVWDNPELPTNPMLGQPLHRIAFGNY